MSSPQNVDEIMHPLLLRLSRDHWHTVYETVDALLIGDWPTLAVRLVAAVDDLVPRQRGPHS